MRRHLLFVLAIVLAVASGSILALASWRVPTPVQRGPEASTVVERHREITLLAASTMRHIPIVFELTNSGAKTIRILEVQRSCTCTETELSTKELAPGSHATLTATVALSPFDRWKPISCMLVTDDPDEKIKRFTAKFNVVQPIEFAKEYHDLGSVSLHETIDDELELFFNTKGGSAPEITSVRGNVPELSAKIGGPPTRGGRTGETTAWKVPIVLSFTATLKMLDTPLSLTASAIVDGNSVSTEIPLHWKPTRQFEVTPARVVLAASPSATEPPASIVSIRKCDGTAFRILDVACGSQRIAAHLNPPVSNDQGWVTVRATSWAEADQRTAAVLRVSTDCAAEPLLLIPVVLFTVPH